MASIIIIWFYFLQLKKMARSGGLGVDFSARLESASLEL